MALVTLLGALSAVASAHAALAAGPALLTVDGLIIGRHVGGRWRNVDHRFAPSLRRTRFRYVDVGRLGRTFWVNRAGGEEATGGSYLDQGEEFVPGVAVSGLAPSIPRKVQSLPTRSSVYGGIVARFLRNQGLNVRAPRLTRIVTTDLDGDGTREVVVEAQSRDELGRFLPGGWGSGENTRVWTARDYSLVLLRWVRNGVAQERALGFTRGPLRQNDPGSGIEEMRLRAVADLDGDGRMEIVVGTNYYEGSGGMLYTYRRGVLQKALSNGAGV